MTHLVQTYWKWDEKFNDTPYKLGADINDLLQQGLVKPNIDNPRSFLGSAEGAPENIEVFDGKVNFILFSSLKKSIFPFIIKVLLDREQDDLITALEVFLQRIPIAQFGDTLLVEFSGGYVTTAILYRD